MMNNSPLPPEQDDIAGDRRITLEQLRVFAAVARTKSFQAAGLRLGRTQSAITQSIKNLEDYLDCRLLERRQGSVLGLTEEGGRLLPEAVDIIKKVDMLVQSARRSEAQEPIRLGIPLDIGMAELHSLRDHCQAGDNRLKIQMISDTSMRLAAMLENGGLDAAIMNEGVNEGIPTTMQAKAALTHTILEEQLAWVSNPKALQDWADEVPLIAFSKGSPWTQAALGALHEAGIAHYCAYVSPSFESIIGAVNEGLGLTVLPVSKIPEKCASIADDPRLPPLPKVRTVIRARTRSKAVLELCGLIEQLPFFTGPDAQ